MGLGSSKLPYLHTQEQVDRANELAAKRGQGILSVAELNEFLDFELEVYRAAVNHYNFGRRFARGEPAVEPHSPKERARLEVLFGKEGSEELSTEELDECIRLLEKGRHILEDGARRLFAKGLRPHLPEVAATERAQTEIDKFAVYPEPRPSAMTPPAISIWDMPMRQASNLSRSTDLRGFLDDETWIELSPENRSSRSGFSALLEPSSVPQSEQHTMARASNRIISVSGTKYLPLALAAWTAQASDRTIRRWIDKAISFNGHDLKSYTSPTTGEVYLSQESVGHLERRFIKWPSKKPAGLIAIGETQNHEGFFDLTAAAKIVGISSASLWKWANRGEVPSISRSLDVVKCPISDQLYIREKDVRELAEVRSTAGLKHSRIKPTHKRQAHEAPHSQARRS